LDDKKREVAVAQCGYLFGTVIARMRERDAALPVVLGADLNLGSGDDPDLRSCLPAGWAVADDGGVQHVVATSEFVVIGSRPTDMRGTTDHPGCSSRLLAVRAAELRREGVELARRAARETGRDGRACAARGPDPAGWAAAPSRHLHRRRIRVGFLTAPLRSPPTRCWGFPALT